MTWNNQIKAQKVTQNNQEFLIGTFEIKHVREFTKFTEHLIVSYDEVDEGDQVFEGAKQIKPRYNPEIQRKVTPSKVEKIADFLIYDPKAMFPTNIVIAIPNEVIYDMREDGNSITISLDKTVNQELKKENGNVYLTIIDGQHRIRGIERAIIRVEEKITSINKVLRSSHKSGDENKTLRLELEKQKNLLQRLLSFELLVTFFVDISLEYQAMIFSTINKTQTKVPENLVYSLFGLTKDDSPQKTSLEIVLALNGIEKSPFYNRIKLVGGSYSKGSLIPLSQATMVKSVLKNISNNPREAEKDRFKKRNLLIDNPKKLSFRKYYSSNEDRKIIRILFSYFNAVKESFADETGQSLWTLPSSGKVSNILQTNVGYQALLKVLFDLLKEIPETDRDKKEIYKSYLKKAKSIDFLDSKEEKRYPFTSKSINILYKDMMDTISK